MSPTIPELHALAEASAKEPMSFSKRLALVDRLDPITVLAMLDAVERDKETPTRAAIEKLLRYGLVGQGRSYARHPMGSFIRRDDVLALFKQPAIYGRCVDCLCDYQCGPGACCPQHGCANTFHGGA